MEPSGIRRKVDDLGRVVLPVGMRRALAITDGDEVEVWLEGDRVVLAKLEQRCTFCEAGEELHEFRGRAVCWSCLAALRALAREQASPGAGTGEAAGEQSLLGSDPG